MKATAAQARRLGAERSGWAGFKHNLMRYLGIPENQFYTWAVPTDWINAYLKSNGRPPIKSIEKDPHHV